MQKKRNLDGNPENIFPEKRNYNKIPVCYIYFTGAQGLRKRSWSNREEAEQLCPKNGGMRKGKPVYGKRKNRKFVESGT